MKGSYNMSTAAVINDYAIDKPAITGQKEGVGTKSIQYFWSFVVILASIRGAFVYHLRLPPDKIYAITGILLIGFGLLSLRSMLVSRGDRGLVMLRKAIKINTLFVGFYMLVSMLSISLKEYSMAYLFAIFPIMFSLIKYDKRLLSGIVYTVTFVTAIGVVYFYSIGVNYGFSAVKEAHSLLRDEFFFSRIDDNLLPGGYQGSHHDAANILVMCAVFFLSKALLEQSPFKRALYSAVYVFVLFSILLTGSVTNTIVMMSASSIALMVYARKRPYAIILIICCLFFAMPSILQSLSDYLYFYEKANYDQASLAGRGMYNSLDINSILGSFHSILFGFGFVIRAPMVDSEIAFIKILIQVGIMPFILIMFICFSPFYYIHKYKVNIQAQARPLSFDTSYISITERLKIARTQRLRLMLAAMPVFAGTMTLLHYGSLFRITSVALFCVMLSLFFKEYFALVKVNEQ